MTTQRSSWGREDDPDGAIERILDAAAGEFARRGVLSTSLVDVAHAAGCSRGTLYKYFPDRDALRLAFVEREAIRIGAACAERARSMRSTERADPPTVLAAAMIEAIGSVRADPVLAEWFSPGASRVASDTALRTPVVESMVVQFLETLTGREAGAPGGHAGTALAARWLVRVVLSYLAQPEWDGTEVSVSEREQIETFVVWSLSRYMATTPAVS